VLKKEANTSNNSLTTTSPYPSKAMASNNQTAQALYALNGQTRLLRMALELRNNIYNLFFSSEDSADGALLQVSKQIRTEASSFYYSSHHFKVTVTANNLHHFADRAASRKHSDLVNFKGLTIIFRLDEKHLGQEITDDGYVIYSASLRLALLRRFAELDLILVLVLGTL
jgi:hypothetical protein